MEQRVRTQRRGSLQKPACLARAANDFLPCLCTPILEPSELEVTQSIGTQSELVRGAPLTVTDPLAIGETPSSESFANLDSRRGYLGWPLPGAGRTQRKRPWHFQWSPFRCRR